MIDRWSNYSDNTSGEPPSAPGSMPNKPEMAMARASNMTFKSGTSFHSTARGLDVHSASDPIAPLRNDSKTWFLKVFGDTGSARTSTVLSRASSNENLLKSASDESSIQYLPDSDNEDDLHHHSARRQFTSHPILVRTSEDTERITSREVPMHERKALYLVTSGYTSPHASIRTDVTSSKSIGPESMLSYGSGEGRPSRDAMSEHSLENPFRDINAELNDHVSEEDPFRDPSAPPRNRPTSSTLTRTSYTNSSPAYPTSNAPYLPPNTPTFPVSLLKTLDMASARRSTGDGDEMSMDTIQDRDPDEASTETMSSKTSSFSSSSSHSSLHSGPHTETSDRKSYASAADTEPFSEEPMSPTSYTSYSGSEDHHFPDYPHLTHHGIGMTGGRGNNRNSAISAKTLVPVRRDSEDTLTRTREVVKMEKVEKRVTFDVVSFREYGNLMERWGSLNR
ncbi:hypothetical protein HDV00_010493 [Rhizophlyctis rosea]|nr:hypothetical protein HDV00_010493 [Rhizophlyctis rosea]